MLERSHCLKNTKKGILLLTLLFQTAHNNLIIVKSSNCIGHEVLENIETILENRETNSLRYYYLYKQMKDSDKRIVQHPVDDYSSIVWL